MEKNEIKKTLEELVDIDEDAKNRLKKQAELQAEYEDYIEAKKQDIDEYYNKIYEKTTKEFYNIEIKQVLQDERQIEKTLVEEKQRLTKAIDESKDALVSKLFDYMVLGGTL